MLSSRIDLVFETKKLREVNLDLPNFSSENITITQMTIVLLLSIFTRPTASDKVKLQIDFDRMKLIVFKACAVIKNSYTALSADQIHPGL